MGELFGTKAKIWIVQILGHIKIKSPYAKILNVLDRFVQQLVLFVVVIKWVQPWLIILKETAIWLMNREKSRRNIVKRNHSNLYVHSHVENVTRNIQGSNTRYVVMTK